MIRLRMKLASGQRLSAALGVAIVLLGGAVPQVGFFPGVEVAVADSMVSMDLAVEDDASPLDLEDWAIDIKQVDLRPHFVEGRSARYSYWSIRQMSMVASNGQQQQRISQSFEMNGELSWSVKQVDANGNATCVLSYDWLEMTVTAPDGTKMVVDTRRGAGSGLAAAGMHEYLSAVSGKDLEVKVTADGQVKQISGVQAIRSAMKDSDAAPEEIEMIATARKLALLDQAPEALSIGQTWQTDIELPHDNGKMQYDSTYRLADVSIVEGVPLAIVQTRDKLKLIADVPEVPAGVEASVKMRQGEARSVVMYDLDRHEAVGRNEFERTVIETKVSMPGRTVLQLMEEKRQGQLLRIEEQGPSHPEG